MSPINHFPRGEPSTFLHQEIYCCPYYSKRVRCLLFLGWNHQYLYTPQEWHFEILLLFARTTIREHCKLFLGALGHDNNVTAIYEWNHNPNHNLGR